MEQLRPDMTPVQHNKPAAFILASAEFVRERVDFLRAVNKGRSFFTTSLTERDLHYINDGPACFKDLFNKHVGVDPIPQQTEL